MFNKRLVLLLLIIFFSFSQGSDLFSQELIDIDINPEVEIINANRIFAKDVVQILEGWRFSPGDSIEWADTNYDDSNWVTTNSTFTNENLFYLDEINWNGVGWFRKKIMIDSSLVGVNLAVTLYQRAATETYINGELWKQFGKIQTKNVEERRYRNLSFFVSPFEVGKEYTIAVRMSNQKMNDYAKNWTYGGFSLIVGELERMLQMDKHSSLKSRTHSSIIITFTSAFFLLHILMFVFYPKDKSNLFYALAILCLSLATYFASGRLFTTNADNLIDFAKFEIILVIIFHQLFLLLTYTLVKAKKGIVFWVLAISAISISIFLYLTGLDNVKFFEFFTYIIYAEMIRIIIVTRRNSIDDSDTSSNWIVATGMAVTIGLIILFNFGLYLNIQFAQYYSIFPLMISMSVFQARKLAKNNEILEYRLNRINALSEENLKQAKIEMDLRLETEKQEAKYREAEYRAKVAEIQSKALAAESERKTAELEEARNLQLSMLPKELPKHTNIQIAAKMATATEVGGDFYDFIENDSGCLTLAVGDATGHGLSAGTMVTTVKALFRNARVNQTKSLVTLFHDMTAVIKEMKFRKIYMSLILARFKNHELEVTSSGMPPILYYNSEEKRVEVITIKGMPLGSVRDFPYQTKSVQFNVNDVFLFYTDGLSELFNSKKEQFGLERIKHTLEQWSDESPEFLIDAILNNARNWLGDTNQHDDITIVAVKIKN